MARNPGRGRRCSFESLETRRLLAGDVTARIVNGDLVIKGDSLDNGITIAAGATAGQVIVTGVNAGGSATSVNDTSNGAITLSGFTGALKIDMKGGNDSVTITDLTVSGKAKLKGGRGDDEFSLDGVTFGRSLDLSMGKDDDTLSLTDVEVTDKANIKARRGNDDVTIDGSTFKTLSVKLSKGDDDLTVTDTDATVKTHFKGGHGANTYTGSGNTLAGLKSSNLTDESTTGPSPTLAISGASSVNEGAVYTLNLSSTGTGGDTITKWTITWGDGSAAQVVTGDPSSVTHTFADGPNSRTISATATNPSGTFAANTLTVTVNNVSPTLAISGAASVTEGSLYTLTLASSAEPGTDTITKWTINWGDGTAAQDVTGNPTSVTHTFADGPATRTISATATDDDGTFAAGNTVSVVVNNVAPTLAISGPATINAGAIYTLNLTRTDAGADTISQWTINWGDGSAAQVVTGNPTNATHTYAAGPNNYTISATATDEDGTFAAGNTVAVSVAAAVVGPTLGITGPASVNEGATYTLTLAAAGTGASTITKWTINWGDGTAAQDVAGNPGSVTHTFADGPNTRTISATATNPDGTFSAVNTVPVSVANVAPTLAISGAANVNQGSLYTLTLLRTDVGADTISQWTITWGDGSAAQVVTGNPTNATHTYAAGPNNYTISATATDEDGTFAAGNTVAVAVSNGAQSFAINGSATVNEGATYTLALSSQNAGTISQWTINWGDGSAAQVVTGSPTRVTHVYADGPNTRTISATATNGSGTFPAGNNIGVTVANIVPTVSFTGSSVVNEGTVDNWALALTDPGSDTVTQYVIHWGDGSANTTLTPAQLAAADGTVQHAYTDGANSYTITVDVTDEDGTYLARATRPVTVSNVPPFLNVTGPLSVAANASNNWTLGSIIDPGADTVTQYIVRWGDGNTSTFTPAEIAGLNRVISHTYTSANTYTLAIDLVDEDGTFTEAGGLLVTVTA